METTTETPEFVIYPKTREDYDRCLAIVRGVGIDFGILPNETITVTDVGGGLFEIDRGNGVNWMERQDTYTIGRYRD